MTLDLRLLAYSALLAWIMVCTASTLRARSWNLKGVLRAFGNRDDLPDMSPIAGRADRAAKNMLENLVLFTALVVAGHLSDADPHGMALGARIFFWSRVVYFPLYLAGVKFFRSFAWGVSLVGFALMLRAML